MKPKVIRQIHKTTMDMRIALFSPVWAIRNKNRILADPPLTMPVTSACTRAICWGYRADGPGDEVAEPFVSRAKAPPAKRSEKGYGDENGKLLFKLHWKSIKMKWHLKIGSFSKFDHVWLKTDRQHAFIIKKTLFGNCVPLNIPEATLLSVTLFHWFFLCFHKPIQLNEIKVSKVFIIEMLFHVAEFSVCNR